MIAKRSAGCFTSTRDAPLCPKLSLYLVRVVFRCRRIHGPVLRSALVKTLATKHNFFAEVSYAQADHNVRPAF